MPITPSAVSPDPVAQAKAEWAANASGCQSTFIGERTYVAFRAAELVGSREARAALQQPARAPSSDPADVQARAEWDALSVAAKLAWVSADVFLAARRAEIRCQAR